MPLLGSPSAGSSPSPGCLKRCKIYYPSSIASIVEVERNRVAENLASRLGGSSPQFHGLLKTDLSLIPETVVYSSTTRSPTQLQLLRRLPSILQFPDVRKTIKKIIRFLQNHINRLCSDPIRRKLSRNILGPDACPLTLKSPAVPGFFPDLSRTDDHRLLQARFDSLTASKSLSLPGRRP